MKIHLGKEETTSFSIYNIESLSPINARLIAELLTLPESGKNIYVQLHSPASEFASTILDEIAKHLPKGFDHEEVKERRIII